MCPESYIKRLIEEILSENENLKNRCDKIVKFCHLAQDSCSNVKIFENEEVSNLKELRDRIATCCKCNTASKGTIKILTPTLQRLTPYIDPDTIKPTNSDDSDDFNI